jgi:glycosyltransferase involved in cell wall biosynthesis
MAAERRLLVVTESLGIGGTEVHLVRLLVPLAAQGWHVAVYCLDNRGKHADEVEAAGIQVVSSGRSQRDKRGRRTLGGVARSASHLFGFMRQWRPHIIHFYLPGPYIIGAPLAIVVGAPVKIMSRRSLSRYQERRPALAWLERRLHRAMDAAVGNSRAVVSELVSEGVPARKIRLIYNGIDPTMRFPQRLEARRELGIGDDALVGVIVANLIPYKGHADLIEGLASVAEGLPSGWRVLCVGRNDGLQPALETLVASHGLGQNIQFLGERSDLPRLLAAADFGMLSSWEEGFSNFILESMAAKLPMIVTEVGGNPEAVVHEETGLVVPPRDPSSLGKAALRLSHDPDLRLRLGAAAYARLEQVFSLERCVTAHNALYEDLLTKTKSRI